MDNRKTVIGHLQIIHTWVTFALENNLNFDKKLIANIAEWGRDAIDYLKNEPVEPTVIVWEKTPGGRKSKKRKVFCGNCHVRINVDANYCDRCGRPVKWDADGA